MPVLMIGAAERQRIAEMIAYAKAHPVLLTTVRAGAMAYRDVLLLKDRKPGFKRPQSQHIMIPVGYHAAFSIEQQPSGFCSHLSISVEGRTEKGKIPSTEAVKMIAEEFGVPYPADKMWSEEFDPGEFAVNLLSLYAPAQEGHA